MIKFLAQYYIIVGIHKHSQEVKFLNTKLNLHELLSFADRHKYFTYASWLLAGTSSLIAILPFWFIWRIACSVILADDPVSIALYGKLALVSAASSMLVYIAGLMCSHKAAFRVAASIQARLINHIATLPLGVIESLGTGHLRRLVLDTSATTETYLAHQLPDKAAALGSSLGITILLFWSDWRLALVSLAPIALGFVIMSFMTGENMRRKITEYQNALNLMSNEAVEYVRGMPVIKAFGQSIHSFRRLQKAIMNYELWTTAYTQELRLPMICFTLAINSTLFFLILAGTFIALTQGVSREFLMSFVLAVIAAPLVSTTLMRTIRQNENEMLSADALRRVNELLSLRPLPVPATPRAVPHDPDVELQGVSFSYGRTQAVSDVTLTVRHGQTLALVGSSGSGKSTLAKLIARFFDPDKGRVSLGGVNVRDIDPHDLMNTIAFVFQDSKVIRGTVLENVRLARPGASREEVIAAMEAAHCMDKPLDTVIGSEGVHLSGGQVQRLCVARALLKDAPIVILDEAAAYADPDNEALMTEALSALSRSKTVIMIAHRLSSVRNADVIAVMDGGRLTESGTFDELIDRKGAFFRMWNEYQASLSWGIRRDK